MSPDRETVTEIVVAVAAVVLFAAGIVAVGVSSGKDVDGIMLVGAMAGFVLVMAAIGTAFAYR
jgi:Sec-independent protein secretion pathway component TatC